MPFIKVHFLQVQLVSTLCHRQTNSVYYCPERTSFYKMREIVFCHLFFFGVKCHNCDCMHPFRVLGLFCVGHFSVAWYTSNYLSPTIYVFSENGSISVYQFILLIFSMQVVGLFEYFFLLNYETLSLKLCHSSFIMYYICNQNHLKACYDDNEIFNKHLYILYESYY